MPPKSVLKRGFKAKAERQSIEYREKMRVHPCAPLSAFELATFLRISVFKATDFVKDSEEIKLLSGSDGKECEWSALTMVTQAGNRIIIHNSFHSEVRQQSDMMHELAHIICDHKINEPVHDFVIPFGMRHYDEVQEEEAKCLGAALQIAKPGLFWAIKNNMSYEEISAHFKASVEMVTYRMNITGLAKRAAAKRLQA